MKRCAVLLAAILLSAGPLAAADTAVIARPIETFATEGDTTTFGRLEYLGGLELTSTNPDFQSISAIRVLPDGRHFIAVADNGFWIDGVIARDSDGRLSGLDHVTVTPMKNASGVHANKGAMDAESLTIRGDRILVGFEGNHRIDAYPLKNYRNTAAKKGPDFLIPRYELRRNGSFEALATNDQGKTVVIAEQSVDKDGNLFAAIVAGPGKGIFKVAKRDGFDVTDATFLPNGDLLVLERRFSVLAGIAMRIRRIPGAAIQAGTLVDGPVIMRADGSSNHIDNMEGIDAIAAPDGSTHLILVSDDNDSVFQDTLMLEFRLIE